MKYIRFFESERWRCTPEQLALVSDELKKGDYILDDDNWIGKVMSIDMKTNTLQIKYGEGENKLYHSLINLEQVKFFSKIRKEVEDFRQLSIDADRYNL